MNLPTTGNNMKNWVHTKERPELRAVSESDCRSSPSRRALALTMPRMAWRNGATAQRQVAILNHRCSSPKMWLLDGMRKVRLEALKILK